MTNFIDVSDLDDEDKKLIQMIVERLKRKPPKKLTFDWEDGLSELANGINPEEPTQKENEFTLAAWDSNVLGKLTREKLYEDR